MVSRLKSTVEEPVKKTNEEIYDDLITREVFTVIDIETTGLAPNKGGEIIEVAAVKVIRGRVVDTMDTLIMPRNRITGKTTQITGIENEDVQGMPPVERVLPELFHFIGNSVIVAHNAIFEERFLDYYMKRSGYKLTNDWLCTMKFFRHLHPERKQMKLGAKLTDLTDFYGVSFSSAEHHRALPDTMATAEAFLEMRKEVLDSEYIQDELMLDTDVDERYVRPTDDVTRFKFGNVSYWEKNYNKKRDQWARRLYIRFTSPEDVHGEVYYDLYSKTFIVQRCENKFTREEKTISMPAFEHALLTHLGVDSVTTYLKNQGVFRKVQRMFKNRVKDKEDFINNLYPDSEVKYIEHVKGEIPYDIFEVTTDEDTIIQLVTNEKRGSKYRYFSTPEEIK